MGAYILDHMLDGLRVQVLLRMCKAYKPHIPMKWAAVELGFENSMDSHHIELYFKKYGCVISDVLNSDSNRTEKVIMTADSVIDSSAHLTQDKLLL